MRLRRVVRLPHPGLASMVYPVQPLHVEAACTEDGIITLRNLPVRRGDSVEVVVIPRSSTASVQELYPLRGEPVEFARPFEPVAENDWEAVR
jgi:hypothetical protein